MYMIREKAQFFKLFHDKKSSVEKFQEYMDSFRPELEHCPCCGTTGNCHIHAHYERYIIDFQNGVPVPKRIRVTRVICKCGKTHAILPDFIVPYCQYSLKYLLQILFAYNTRHSAVTKVCARFGIALSTLNRLKKIYKEHKSIWLGKLEDASTSAKDFLKGLILLPQLSSFLSDFYSLAARSFLQSHANPKSNADGCML